MKRRSFLILNLIILIVLVSGCQGTPAASPGLVPANTAPRINPRMTLPKALNSFPKIAERGPDVPKDYEAVAENDTLRLYVRKASSAIIVEDKRTKHLWRSSPNGLAEDKTTTPLWRRQIEIPVQVSFVDAERSQPKNAKTDRGMELKFKAVQDGVETTYNFPDQKLAFDVIYALHGDCLEATIPDKQVKEKGENGFVVIDLLSYFGATRDGDDGYIVYPDGSGALMSFKTPHPEQVQKINTTIYGSDASGGIIGFSPGLFREQVYMPVFGLATGSGDASAAYVGMVTQGDFDASLGVARAGKGIAYNHVWSTHIFRRQGRFSLTGGQPAWLYQPDRITGDRSVRYCFLNGQQAGYVGMATRYRDFMIKERGAKRIASPAAGAGEETAGTPALPRMYLAFFMGIERKTWFLADMISMTTFREARDILDDLDRAGVRNVDVALWFWNHGSTSGKYPQRLPADNRLGGEADLKALAQDIHQRGQRLFLEDDYLTSAPGAMGVLPYLDAIRGVDGLPVGGADTGYLLNPQVTLRSFAARDIPRIKDYGADGLELDYLGFLTLPDKNQRYPLARESFAASHMQIAGLARRQLGSVSLEGGNIYTLPYVDWLDYISIDSTHFDLFDESVPFFQIIAHGLVEYSNAPYNLVSDGKRIFLRQVEYGALPMFLLTQNNSAQLFRTNANFIYSSQYSFWRSEVIRQYQATEKLVPLINQFITGHQKLAADVYQTTYEDGSRVIVNYGASPYSAGNVNVPGQDFIVLRGD